MLRFIPVQRSRWVVMMVLLFLLFLQNTFAIQGPETISDSANSLVIIGKIEITGNHITHPNIITRELKFHEWDTLSYQALSSLLTAGKENVFNTRLFNFVTFDTIRIPGSKILNVKISVIERWYIWPIPFFDFGDRNFNVWWETKDFSRLTYGVDLTFFNVRGRNETLKILTHLGFDKKFGFNYTTPYINKKQTVGLGFGAEIDLNREVPVITIDNQPVFEKSLTRFLKQQLVGFLELRVRPNIYSLHAFRCSYSSYYFADQVLAVPGFSLINSNFQQFFSFNYRFKNDHRDVQFYPLTGYYFDTEVNFSVPYSFTHNGYLKTNYRKYWQLSGRWYWATGFTGKISLEEERPYYLAQELGYEHDLVRGYEYYIINGQHFVLLKNNLKFALLPSKVIQLNFIKTTKFNIIPLSLYLNLYMDYGYVYENKNIGSGTREDLGNTLQNELLAGFGTGLDFTTYYDFVFRMEFSINLRGQPGFYLHFSAPI